MILLFVRSFCIGLKGSPDLAAAEKVAEFLGTRHFSFEFTVQQVGLAGYPAAGYPA